MKVSKGQSKPYIAAVAFLRLYMVLGRQFVLPGFDYDSNGVQLPTQKVDLVFPGASGLSKICGSHYRPSTPLF